MSGRLQGAREVNGISRCIVIYRPESFDAAVADFSRTLGIEDFDKLELHHFGLRVAVSWNTGLEVIAPLGSDGYSTQAWSFIEQRGEGLFGIVWQVGDLETAERRAAAAGHPRQGDRLDCFLANPAWRQRFSLALESSLAPVAGVGVTLIQLKPRTEGAP